MYMKIIIMVIDVLLNVISSLLGKLPRQVEDGNNGIESFPTALTTSASGSSF